MKTQNDTNTFVRLPDELKIEIFKYLSDKQLSQKVALVCRDFNRLSQDSTLWRKRTLSRYGKIKSLNAYEENSRNWRAAYVSLKKLEMKNLNSTLVKKHKKDDLLNKTERAIGSIIGFTVKPGESHHYRFQKSKIIFLGGKPRKITGFK